MQEIRTRTADGVPATSAKSPLRPWSLDEAQRFLALLDPDEERFIFGAGVDEKIRARKLAAEKAKPWAERHGTISSLRPWIEQAQADGRGIFVTINAMRGRKRLSKDVTFIRAVWHEHDQAAPAPSFPLEPSIQVETSTIADGLGVIFTKVHSYWLIDPEHPLSASEFSDVMATLVDRFGSDKNAKDLARVLRLPGTLHLKDPTNPHPVRIIAAGGARYGRDELLAAFPPPVPQPAPQGKRPTLNGHSLPGLERFHDVLKVIPADDYDTWIKVGQALHAETGGSAAGLETWDAWSASAANWTEGICAAKWDTFKGSGITGGTIFALAQRNGYAKPSKALSTTRAPRRRSEAAAAEEPPPSDPVPLVEVPDNPTEDSIALAFADRHAADLRYDHTAQTWMRWDGSIWVRDKTRLAFHCAREIARAANIEGKPGLAKAATASGVEKFAIADQRLATTSDTWDRDLWLLATPGGTVDLRTGELKASEREHYLTRSTEVAPAPAGTPAPVWEAFLDQATGGDADLEAFLQRLAGYCLTGVTYEQALFFLHGEGGHGKGTFVNTLTAVLKDHARVAPMETFASTKFQRHESELASLHEARFVTAQETEQGKAWNDARIKALTGGDPITACFKHKDHFTFIPKFKLVFTGNHKPQIKAVDAAMRRRFNIIPFTHKPARVDNQLSEKLKAELPAILRWAIDGCLAWQQQGLNPPEIVRGATAEYFEEQDVMSAWIADCVEVGEHYEDTTEALRRSWSTYAAAAGEPEGSTRTFSEMLKRGGYTPQKHTLGAHGKRGWRGLRVKAKDTSNQWFNQNDR